MNEMQVLEGLPEDKLKYIQTKKWYYQRFDACPHFLLVVAYGEIRKEPRKPPGTEAVWRSGFIGKGKSDWYLLEEDNERTTKLFLERAKDGEIGFTESLMKNWEPDEKKFYEMCSRIDTLDLGSLKDEEFIELHSELTESFIRRFTSSSIIDGFALHSDRAIAGKIHEYLKGIGRDNEYDRLFSVLTAPVHLSFTNDAELSLLNVAREVEKNTELKELFKDKSIDEILMRISEFPQIDSLLAEHQRNYFWVHNNYNDAFVLTEEFFIREIKKLMIEGIDIAHELDYIKRHPEKNRENKEALMEELKIPQEIRALIRYSEDFTHWQDERKKSTFFAVHYFNILLKETGKRTGFSLLQLKQLLPSELARVFTGDVRAEELQRRSEGMFFLIGEKKAYVTSDESAIAKLKQYYDSMDLPEGEVKTIKGLTASLGKAKGRVKVLRSAREIGKIEKGDILVAVMTRPDYVLAMKKAAAIVTDEGGITCHAAIVSRELRIPCVIATKFATKVLKDGDIVEVDADNATVTISN